MKLNFRALAGLFALATIALTIPSIVSADSSCTANFTPVFCAVGQRPYWNTNFVLDNTPCTQGGSFGIIYRQGTTGNGGPPISPPCYWAAGNCTCL